MPLGVTTVVELKVILFSQDLELFHLKLTSSTSFESTNGELVINWSLHLLSNLKKRHDAMVERAGSILSLGELDFVGQIIN